MDHYPTHLLQGEYLLNTSEELAVLASPSGFFTLSFYASLNVGGNLAIYHDRVVQIDDYLWRTTGTTNTSMYTDMIALLNNNATFCIYAASAPATNLPSPLCCTGTPNASGQYHLELGDDGVLGIFTGNVLGSGTLLWSSGLSDPPTSVVFGLQGFPINDPYDLANATIAPLDPYTLYSGTLENDADTATQIIVKGNESVPETGVWGLTIINPGTINIPASQQTPPRVAAGKLVDGDTPQSVTINEETEIGRSWNWYELVTVPPDSEVDVEITVQMSTISAPLQMISVTNYKSGYQRAMRFHGTYTGTTSHDMTITVTPVT